MSESILIITSRHVDKCVPEVLRNVPYTDIREFQMGDNKITLKKSELIATYTHMRTKIFRSHNLAPHVLDDIVKQFLTHIPLDTIKELQPYFQPLVDMEHSIYTLFLKHPYVLELYNGLMYNRLQIDLGLSNRPHKTHVSNFTGLYNQVFSSLLSTIPSQQNFENPTKYWTYVLNISTAMLEVMYKVLEILLNQYDRLSNPDKDIEPLDQLIVVLSGEEILRIVLKLVAL